MLIQFHSPALDPMAGNMESTGSEHKDQGTSFVLFLFRFSCPSILRIIARSPQPSMGIPLGYSSFADPFYFLSSRAFYFEREPLCECARFIYLRVPSLSCLVPSYPNSPSFVAPKVYGTLCFLDTSVADDETAHSLADADVQNAVEGCK